MSVAGYPGTRRGLTTQKKRPGSNSRSRTCRSCGCAVVWPMVYVRWATVLPFCVATMPCSCTGPSSKVALTPKLLSGVAAVRKREAGGRKETVPTSIRRTISSCNPS